MPTLACIYCPTGIGTSRDHVPPKAFFEDPVPENAQLITVPCCEDCRKKDHANDELVRNVLTSLKDTEHLSYVSKHLVPRRDRSISRSRSQVMKMMGLMRCVKREDGGAVIEDWAFSLDHPCIAQFLERIGRALLFKELGQEYFKAEFGWRLNPLIPPEVYKFAVSNYPKRNILNVVAYVILRAPKNVHWIILQIYGEVEFMLRYEKRS